MAFWTMNHISAFKCITEKASEAYDQICCSTYWIYLQVNIFDDYNCSNSVISIDHVVFTSATENLLEFLRKASPTSWSIKYT